MSAEHIPDPPHWRVETRGLNLRVWELGSDTDADRTPVICLHSWLGQGLDWWPVVGGLPGRWICPDQRGFGGSDPVGAGGYYHFHDLLPDLDALIDAIGGGPVDLVGHSMGGTVASCYAGALPARVRRLVVVEGLGALSIAEKPQLDRVRAHLGTVRKARSPSMVASVEDAAGRLQRRFSTMTPAHAQLIARNGLRDHGPGLRWAWDPQHRVPGPYPFREAWYLDFLREITAPTLVVWGEESWYAPDVQARRAAALPQVAQVRIPGGHMLNLDAPEPLRACILDHLK